MKPSSIKSINFEIIDICNLQCTMCNIWENKTAHFLSVQDVSHCLEVLEQDIDITLTGGEPFLHPHIIDIIALCTKNGYTISTISTNGMLTDKILETVKLLKQVGIKIPQFHISIDGYGETHDRQRGIIGAFKKSIQTIQDLKKHAVDIKIKYTISRENIRDIKKCFDLSKKLGVEITFKVIENDPNYTNRLHSPRLVNTQEKLLIQKILLEIKNDLYTKTLGKYLNDGKLPFSCSTPEVSLFIMAKGEVYPCTKYSSIGNIRISPLKNLIGNSLHLDIIEEVRNNSCSKCFSPHGSSKSLSHELYQKY